MTLSEFIDEVKASLAAFERIYRNGHISDPQLWPLEQEGGDWWEQFTAADYVDFEAGL